MGNVIVLVPTKVDKEGAVHITPMLISEISEGHKKRLVGMGIFSAQALGIKKKG